MKILAFDPGGATGYCQADVSGTAARIVCGQIENRNHHMLLWETLHAAQPDLVISESFEYRNQARAGLVLVSKEYIGICKLWCILNKKEYREQSPSIAMGFVKDNNIKNLGLWKPGNPHAMDATRHMLYYLTNGPHNMVDLKKSILKEGWRPIV